MSRSSARLLVAAAIWCAAAAVLSWPLVAAPARTAEVAQSSRDLPPGVGSDLVRTSCTACHGADLIIQQRLSRDGWSREIDKMIGWGAVVPDEARGTVLDYLTTRFGHGALEMPDERADAGTALLASRCGACHDRRLVDQQRLDEAGWRRELDKMVGWGATLTEEEKQTLVSYLAGRRVP